MWDASNAIEQMKSRLAQLPNNRIESVWRIPWRMCLYEYNRERTSVSLSLSLPLSAPNVWCCLHKLRNATAVFVYVRFNLICQYDWMTIFLFFRFVLSHSFCARTMLSHYRWFSKWFAPLTNAKSSEKKYGFTHSYLLPRAIQVPKSESHKDKSMCLTGCNRNTLIPHSRLPVSVRVRYSNVNAIPILCMIFALSAWVSR